MKYLLFAALLLSGYVFGQEPKPNLKIWNGKTSVWEIFPSPDFRLINPKTIHSPNGGKMVVSNVQPMPGDIMIYSESGWGYVNLDTYIEDMLNVQQETGVIMTREEMKKASLLIKELRARDSVFILLPEITPGGAVSSDPGQEWIVTPGSSGSSGVSPKPADPSTLETVTGDWSGEAQKKAVKTKRGDMFIWDTFSPQNPMGGKILVQKQ
jgi:hypothetical protein